ncbi:TPA: hypothetical protein NH037_005807 [Pseudomonas aeruginosa]|jgi:hypothetical protein|uniref:hypothetical protein n=1 Tax=Pseudomonas aeruginosa TaxID=287 RepID=UPI0003B9FA3B|nr:hypothetical protein [Pseudomonas aeruginosa]APB65053.1 hypothetical protein BMR72_12000 [Pseudomonas aeruginosa]ARG86795.1 hypothetical protein E613_27050 [Pseudomonas aeruginosa]EIU3605095.1 hypothetical protein [Pseudomonas aeruginosa]EIU3804546.1 hypothetical protein [Pseudomonas aeruginosa]EJU9618254.1 hypothetical protein [Pseudomonas aeruginosa]
MRKALPASFLFRDIAVALLDLLDLLGGLQSHLLVKLDASRRDWYGSTEPAQHAIEYLGDRASVRTTELSAVRLANLEGRHGYP